MLSIKTSSTFVLSLIAALAFFMSSCSKKGISINSGRQIQTIAMMDKNAKVSTAKVQSKDNKQPESIINPQPENKPSTARVNPVERQSPSVTTTSRHYTTHTEKPVILNNPHTRSTDAPITVKTKPANNSDDANGCIYLIIGIAVAIGLIVLFFYAISILSVLLIILSLLAFIVLVTFLMIYAVTDL